MVDLLAHVEVLLVLGFLVSSMLATGLTLTLPAILTPLRDVRLVVLALALNFVLAPVLAWLLTVVLPIQSGHAIGLLLLGGAGGAPFLPKVMQNARGDLALAAALMALLTLGTILFLPFALPLMIPGMHPDAWNIARPLLLLIALPLAIGIWINGIASSRAASAAPVLARVGNAALLLVFILMIALNAKALLGVVGSYAILAALLYFSGLFFLGWLAGRTETRGPLGLSTTARNFGAALVAAESSFSDPAVTVMIIVGAIICLVVSFLAAAWLRRQVQVP